MACTNTYMVTGGPPEVERPSIDKMTLAEMESVIKADLEKRDKEKQDKYQEPLDSQKEKGKHVCILYHYTTDARIFNIYIFHFRSSLYICYRD